MFDSESESSDFEGFTNNDLGANIHLSDNEGSDISVSTVSTVNTADLSDFSDEDSDFNVDIIDCPKWKKELSSIKIHDFRMPVGPSKILSKDKNELDFFDIVFPPELYVLLADETNRYARQSQVKKDKVDKTWKPTSAVEIRAFLGMHVYMSIVKLPSYKMYWSTDSYYGDFKIKNIMTRTRFEKILEYFHANDSLLNPKKGEVGHDKLHHVRKLLDALSETFISSYNPHKECSVDEALVAFRGRLGFRQYMPNKPHKYGIKIWVRADGQNGYTNEFQVYIGKVSKTAEVGLTKNVVLSLCKKLEGKYYHLYCDNFFSSVDLFRDLFRRKIYACGTVRTNRKFWPVELKKQNLAKKDKGFMECFQDENLVAYGWMDNKPVFILSTNSDPTKPITVPRKQTDGSKKDIPAPPSIQVYNQFMNGVDTADQNRTTYGCTRRSKKWWKYIFWYLFDTAVANALILMQESPNHQILSKTGKAKKKTNLSFRMSFSKLLIGTYTPSRKRKSVTNSVVCLDEDHWPKKKKPARCKVCSSQGKRSEPRTGCDACDVNLCIGDCYKNHHKK